MTGKTQRCNAGRKLWRTEEFLGMQLFETQYPRVRSLVPIPTVLSRFQSTYNRNVINANVTSECTETVNLSCFIALPAENRGFAV